MKIMAGHQVVLYLKQWSYYMPHSIRIKPWLKLLSIFLLSTVLFVGLGFGLVAGARSPELVDIQAIAPTIQLDLRYATPNNFTREKLYQQARCLLRPTVAARLSNVQTDLSAQGLGLKVFDCYRPLSVQKRMWELVPDANYVADPKFGSRHNRGSAVDVSLVDRQGQELPMPSEFDEFSPRSHLDYQAGSPAALQNRAVLQHAMQHRGFTSIQTEWWHFDAPNWQSYPLLDLPLDTRQKAEGRKDVSSSEPSFPVG